MSQLKDKSQDETSNAKDGNGKPYFKCTLYELYRYKRKRIFKCSKCDQREPSEKLINNHYCIHHGKLRCDKCGSFFNTFSALRKHSYEHKNIPDKNRCIDCGKGFPFASQLAAHHKKHLKGLEHHCVKSPKSFINKGELTKHQNVHSGKTWSCQKQNCDYTCKDLRNLKAHMHKHGDNSRYKCITCGKGFKHYQQLKHHKGKPCQANNVA